MDWLTTSWETAARALVTLVAVYAAILLYTRVVGLRSFSKMSAGDFAMTVAVGSLLASAALSTEVPLLLALSVLAGLFALQWALAAARTRCPGLVRVAENEPLLLVHDGRIDDAALFAANMTRSDLAAKLREANALCLEDVRAVVFETTGDVSVLHAQDGKPLDHDVLLGVRTVSGEPASQLGGQPA